MVDAGYIVENASERDRLAALVAQLSEEDLSRELDAGWTVGAVLAHLAFWDQRVVAILDKWEQSGVIPTAPRGDPDIINDAAKPLFLAMAPRKAALLALEAAKAADTRVETLTPEALDALRAAGNPINPRRFEHRREHIDQIERALQR